ncbi:hypothetical protein C4J81_04375 [Deltaproteobacteria bacterium Smac51]|nr:hypothetical protein C4J81_04375 [Deltaproteobacteria bacterium Smac51]
MVAAQRAALFKGLGLIGQPKGSTLWTPAGGGPTRALPQTPPAPGGRSPLDPQEVRVSFNFLLPASPQLASSTKLRQAATLHTTFALTAVGRFTLGCYILL